MANRRTRHNEAKRMNRVARVGDKNDVARCGDRLGEVGEPFFRSQGDYNFAIRIEINAEPPRVICGAGATQAVDTARH